MADNNKGKGRYNRSHKHGKPKGKGKGKGGGGESSLEKALLKAARGSAKLAFGGVFDELKEAIRKERNREGTINAAFDKYASDVASMLAANQAGTGQIAGMLGSLNQNVMGQQGAVANQQVADANQAQNVLGQTGQNAQAAGQLGAGGQAALGGYGALMSGYMGDLGIGQHNVLSNFRAIAEMARLQAHAKREERISELKREKRSARKEKRAYVANEMQELSQQEFENRLALMGIRGDKRQQKFDNKLARDEFALDFMDTMADNQRADRDQRHDNRGGGGKGGGGKGGHGRGPNAGGGPLGSLSPSQREEFHDSAEQVNAARSLLTKYIRQGMTMQEARDRAEREGEYGDWVFQVAMSLVQNGSLSRRARQIWRSHVPGDGVPRGWR